MSNLESPESHESHSHDSHNSRSLRRWPARAWPLLLPAVVLVGTLMIYYWPELFRGRAYLYSDILHGGIPFLTDVYRGPSVDAAYQWTNSILFGFSYARNGVTIPFHAPGCLLALVFDPTATLTLSGIWHFSLSFVFMVLFLRAVGVGLAAACFGALAFTFAGSATQRHLHPWSMAAVLTTPLCFWLAEKAATRRAPAYAVLLGVVLGHIALAGHPQFVAYQAPIVCLYYLYRRRQEGAVAGLAGWARVAGVVGLVALICFGVAAVYWVPVAASALGFVEGGGRLYMTPIAMDPIRVVLAHLAPRAVGSDFAHSGGASLVAHSWEWSVYIGIVPVLFLPLALTRLARKRFRTGGFFLALWLLSCCFLVSSWRVAGMSLGDLYELIPVWKLFHHIYRFVFLGCFALACLCAMGLQRLLDAEESDKPRERSRVRRVPIAVWGSVALLALLSTAVSEGVRRGVVSWPAWAGWVARSGGSFSHCTSLVSPTVLFSTGAIAILLLCRWRAIGPRAMVWLLAGVLSADLLLYALPAKPTDPVEAAWTPPPLVQAGIRRGQRVLSLAPRHYFDERGVPPQEQRRGLNTNLGIYDGIEECGGYVTLTLPPGFYDFYDLLGAHVPYRHTDFFFNPPPDLNVTLPLVRACSIEYVITKGAVDVPGLSLLARDRDLYAYRVAGTFPRAYTVSRAVAAPSPETAVAFLAGCLQDKTLDLANQAVTVSAEPLTGPFVRGQARVVSREPTLTRVEVAAEGKTFLVLTDAYRPEWKAYIDGRPARLYQANGIFRGVPVPAGTHTVDFRYEDGAYHTGKWLTFGTLGLAGGFLLLFGVRRWLRRSSRA